MVNESGTLTLTWLVAGLPDDVAAVEVLINAGADLTLTDDGGKTALDRAKAAAESEECVALLESVGAPATR